MNLAIHLMRLFIIPCFSNPPPFFFIGALPKINPIFYTINFDSIQLKEKLKKDRYPIGHTDPVNSDPFQTSTLLFILSFLVNTA